jgi:hypothetical protein
MSQLTTNIPVHPFLLQHCAEKLRYGNSQDAPLLTNGLRKCGIYIQWNFIQPLEK